MLLEIIVDVLATAVAFFGMTWLTTLIVLRNCIVSFQLLMIAFQ